jgi:hypothetical protein
MTLPSNLADVETLLAERDAVAGWIAKLDAAGSTVPVAVRDRVRLDYQLRMDGVTHRLQGHGDAIAAKLAEDRAEREAAAGAASTARDALAEAELRHIVGEYDSARFESEASRHSADIERHERALGAVAERVRRLEEVLALIVAPIAEGRVETTTASHAETVAAVSSDETVMDEPLALVDDDLDVLDESLLSIFDEAEAPADLDVELVDDVDSTESAPPATTSDDRGPLSFRPGTGMPLESERVIPSFGMPAEIPARFTPAPEPTRSAPPPVATPAPTRGPMFEEDIVAAGPPPEPMTISAGRTLRCAECGAMNKASEWYCEKCGAELNVG